MTKHRVLIGINYPDGAGGEKRAEPGDIVDDLPAKSVKWLEADGIVENTTAKSQPVEDGED